LFTLGADTWLNLYDYYTQNHELSPICRLARTFLIEIIVHKTYIIRNKYFDISAAAATGDVNQAAGATSGFQSNL
jgi:hypothetical protein